MSSDQLNLPMPIGNDGFDETDDASNRVVHGDMFKCVDGVWTYRNGLPVPKKRFLLTSTATIIQKWEDGSPVETIWKRPGQPFPDVDELNAAIPQSEWEEGIDGSPKPPHQLERVVYLIDEATAERFTFVSGTTGAEIAVRDLRQRVQDKRFMCGEGVLPIVEFGCKPMKTKYGQKLRPEFVIVDWRDAGGNAQQLKDVTPLTLAEQTGDAVKY
jgi:hypothetical protein